MKAAYYLGRVATTGGLASEANSGSSGGSLPSCDYPNGPHVY
jgi:hypothetical protein